MKRNIVITVGGGMGDQVCFEPIARYMKETFFRNDNLHLMTQYPEIFKHLDVTCHSEDKHFGFECITCNTHPKEVPYLDFERMHPLDFISILLFRRTLPNANKRIKIQVDQTAYNNVALRLSNAGIYNSNRKPKFVLVHPGKSWQSKTFPKEIWQGYINILEKNGYDVVVFGKELPQKAGFVDVKGMVMLTDLTTEEMFALISMAPVLISNDSAPIHIAGAFDNYIGLIATAKRPDYILPYRYESQLYKAKSLEKYPLYNDFELDPLVYSHIANAIADENKLLESLPTTEDILNFVREVFKCNDSLEHFQPLKI